MNKKIISVALALAVAITAAAFVFKKQTTLNREEAVPTDQTNPAPTGSAPGATTSPAQAPGATTSTPDTRTGGSPSAPAAKAAPFGGASGTESAAAAQQAQAPLKPEEKKSMQMLTRAMVKYIQPKYSKPDAMIADLKKAGLDPVIAKDFNDATGKMIQVRSEKSLPGQRYLHAQYFEDEEKQQFPQHISSEFRPASDCMPVAIASALSTIKEMYPGNAKLGKPIQVSADFVKFNLPDNRELWIKKLGAEDLAGDPFNAHDPVTDVGTCKMAVEQIPDDHGDAGHHE